MSAQKMFLSGRKGRGDGYFCTYLGGGKPVPSRFIASGQIVRSGRYEPFLFHLFILMAVDACVGQVAVFVASELIDGIVHQRLVGHVQTYQQGKHIAHLPISP